MINGNMVGGTAPIKTVIITDENGNEFTGVVTGSEVIFTATDNDVRKGMVYASDSGVSAGTKDIPAYRTEQGAYLVFPEESFLIPLPDYDLYDYTKIQCMFSIFNTSAFDSVLTDKVAINDNVYLVNSPDIVSSITKNTSTKSIDFNIANDTEDIYMIHYFTYREEC